MQNLVASVSGTKADRRADHIGNVLVWDLAGSLSDEERMDREERAAIRETDG